MYKVYSMLIALALLSALFMLPQKAEAQATDQLPATIVNFLSRMGLVLPEWLSYFIFFIFGQLPVLCMDILNVLLSGVRTFLNNNPEFIQGAMLGVMFCGMLFGALGCPFCIVGAVPSALLGAVFGIPFGLCYGCLDWMGAFMPTRSQIAQQEANQPDYVLVPVPKT
ncbi:MAG: hypothetical protein SVE93_00170 [Candidatus Thermoplasmatota archaeon]|nr:hypothetical protein [Candidatus Thermoplasmatota archaeon]